MRRNLARLLPRPFLVGVMIGVLYACGSPVDVETSPPSTEAPPPSLTDMTVHLTTDPAVVDQAARYAAAYDMARWFDAITTTTTRPPVTTAPPTPKPPRPSGPVGSGTAPASGDGSVWDRLAYCEAGGNWATNTGNGYSGGLQFAHSTWPAYGGTEFAPMAWQATRAQQIVVAERILASHGGKFKAWPGCRAKLGLP